MATRTTKVKAHVRKLPAPGGKRGAPVEEKLRDVPQPRDLAAGPSHPAVAAPAPRRATSLAEVQARRNGV